jgi:hypothetical protein
MWARKLTVDDVLEGLTRGAVIIVYWIQATLPAHTLVVHALVFRNGQIPIMNLFDTQPSRGYSTGAVRDLQMNELVLLASCE